MRTLPPKVTLLVNNFDAWIVGSAALIECDLENVRDIDVLVPFHEWHSAVSNSFGGWKFLDGDKEVDVWPGDLSHLAKYDKFKAAWHPFTGKRLYVQ